MSGLRRRRRVNVDVMLPNEVAVRLPELDERFEEVHQRIDQIQPRRIPPDGQRFKTRADYAAEYTNAPIERQLEILAIQCGMLPRETVDAEVKPNPERDV